MSNEFSRLKYIDARPIFCPRLKFYPGGIALPSDDGTNVIKVSPGERITFLKQRNGDKPCWKEMTERVPRRVSETESTEE